MIREAIASVLYALADRIAPDVPSVKVETQIQYVYVYSAPPSTTQWPQWPYPTITCSTATSAQTAARLPVEVKGGFAV